jgi:CDP-ribitol ribitolphosphotransferase
MLRHKKSLTVIQMWHALGKIKQSGYQTLDKESGRSKTLSRLLCMHKNYDYIIAGGKAWNPYYVASFDTQENRLVNIGLPRIDYLLETAEENRQKVLKTYPEFADKTVILYAPTFRRGYEAGWQDLLTATDFENCVLVVKGHPNQPLTSNHPKVHTCPEFSAVEMLSTCDYLITDYSAIAVEGAILNKQTYYYLYDYQEYTTKNGLNVDPFVSMPDCAFTTATQLMAQLQKGQYPQENLDGYRKKYLPEHLGTSTLQLATFILQHCK